MDPFQPLACHVRIYLRGGNIGMAQQHLHDTQVGAMVEQVRSKSMAQRVRRKALAMPALRAWRLIRYQKAWRVMAEPREVTNSALDNFSAQ